MIRALKEDYLAFLFIFLVTFIYLHPIFLGKVDTPVDIRDVQMYPWRYYSVDKKIKKYILWESVLPSKITTVDDEIKEEVSVFKASTIADDTLRVRTSYNKTQLENLDDVKEKYYYLTFDFRPLDSKLFKLDFNVNFVSKYSDHYIKPGIRIYPSSLNKRFDNPKWYKAYIPLQEQIPLSDLSFYDIEFSLKNPNKINSSLFYIRDLKLVFEDFSKVQGIHNYFLDDLVQGFTPAREFFSNSLKKWKVPFWNNYVLTGCEYLAEHQVGYFHPLYFLSYFLFDHFTAHLFITFICFFLCGIGAYCLARYWSLSFIPSLFTGVVYMFHPFNVVWFSFEHILMISSVLPFLIISYEKNIKDQKILNKYLLTSTALLGLIFISGHLQHVYYAVIFFFLFVVYRFVQNLIIDKRVFLKHLFSILFVFILALMIGAVVTVPFFPLIKDSYRVSWSIDFIKASSIPLKAFWGLLFPYYCGYPKWLVNSLYNVDWSFARNYVYFGFLPFIFLLFSIKTLFKNKLTPFFLLTILFSILVSTGSPFFFFIRDFIPGFKQLQHYRFLQVYSFCVPFLAGIGLEVILNYFTSMKIIVKKILIIVVLLVSVIDLMYYSSYFVSWSDRKEYKPIHKGGALEFLIKEKSKSKEPFRVLPFTLRYIRGVEQLDDIAKPNTLQTYELEDASGYISLVSKDLYYLFVYSITKNPKLLYQKEIINIFSNPNIPYPIYNFRSKILDLLNVKYFLVPNILVLQSNDVEKVFSKDCTVYENKNYLPRAFFVPDFKVIESPKNTIVELDGEEFDPKREVILMSYPNEVPSVLTPEKVETQHSVPKYNIDFVKYEQNNITLKLKVNSPGFLVLGHNLNDSWKVKVNGKESKHMQANLVQRAIYLPDIGNYNIQFYYFPKRFLIGLLISCVAVFILAVMAINLRFR